MILLYLVSSSIITIDISENAKSFTAAVILIEFNNNYYDLQAQIVPDLHLNILK